MTKKFKLKIRQKPCDIPSEEVKLIFLSENLFLNDCLSF